MQQRRTATRRRECCGAQQQPTFSIIGDDRVAWVWCDLSREPALARRRLSAAATIRIAAAQRAKRQAEREALQTKTYNTGAASGGPPGILISD